MTYTNHEEQNEVDKTHKIDALREMITNAERTIQSAKAMLLQLEGKKKTGRKRKVEATEDGTVIEGTFDGQIMIGTDGKQYPVPANYASKSKLVEGDMLKLTITPDGSFVYKQIGPIDRAHALGIISQDERGNYYIFSEGKPFKVLLASITYFKAEPGDEVAIVKPRDLDSSWAAIENVLQKSSSIISPSSMQQFDKEIEELKNESKNNPEPIDHPFVKKQSVKPEPTKSVLDEWMSDIEELEKEIKEEQERNEK